MAGTFLRAVNDNKKLQGVKTVAIDRYGIEFNTSASGVDGLEATRAIQNHIAISLPDVEASLTEPDLSHLRVSPLDAIASLGADKALNDEMRPEDDFDQLLEQLDDAMDEVDHTATPTDLKAGVATTAASSETAEKIGDDINMATDTVETAEHAIEAVREAIEAQPSLAERFNEHMAAKEGQEQEQSVELDDMPMAPSSASPSSVAANGAGSIVTSQIKGASEFALDDGTGYQISSAAPGESFDAQNTKVSTVSVSQEDREALLGRIEHCVEPCLNPASQDEQMQLAEEMLQEMEADVAELKQGVEFAADCLHNYAEGPITEGLDQISPDLLKVDAETEAKLNMAGDDVELQQETMRQAFVTAKPLAPGGMG